MNRTKLIAKTKSSNLWWGIYGLWDKTEWEDVFIYNDADEYLGGFCLCAKRHFRNGLGNLRIDPDAQEQIQRIELHLSGTEIDYYFFYDEADDEDFHEVAYDAPQNDKGIKPRYMEIWYPHETIGLSTLHAAIEHFAHKFLKLHAVDIHIDETDAGFEETLQSFKEHVELGFFNPEDLPFVCDDEVIDELSNHWRISKEETRHRLNRSIGLT